MGSRKIGEKSDSETPKYSKVVYRHPFKVTYSMNESSRWMFTVLVFSKNVKCIRERL